MPEISAPFLSSQPLYLPEGDVIRYRNELASLFGLNENQILINISNDNTGNIYRQILIDKEAYARYMKHLVTPTEVLTKQEQEQVDSEQAQEQDLLNLINVIQSSEMSFLNEMLMMFAQFFYLQELAQNELIIKYNEAKAKEEEQAKLQQEQERMTPIIMDEYFTPKHEETDPYFELQQDFLAKIKIIDGKINDTKAKLKQIQARKQTVSTQINAQRQKVAQINQQIQTSESALKSLDDQLQAQIQERERLMALIQEKKGLKKQKKEELARTKEKNKDKREQSEQQIQVLQAEFDKHIDAADALVDEMEQLEAVFRSDEGSKEDRQAAVSRYYELETEQFIERMYGFAADEDKQDAEVEIKKLDQEEEIIHDHIELLRKELKGLKRDLRLTEDEIKRLNEEKAKLTQEYEQLLQDRDVEQSKLIELESKFKALENQEGLLYENMNNLVELKSLHEKELFISQTLMAISEKQTKLQQKKKGCNDEVQKAQKAIDGITIAYMNKVERIEAAQKLIAEKGYEPGSPAYKKQIKIIDKLTRDKEALQKRRDEQYNKKATAQEKLAPIQAKLDKNKQSEATALVALKDTQEQIQKLNHVIEARAKEIERFYVEPTRLGPPDAGFRPQYQGAEQPRSAASIAPKHNKPAAVAKPNKKKPSATR